MYQVQVAGHVPQAKLFETEEHDEGLWGAWGRELRASVITDRSWEYM